MQKRVWNGFYLFWECRQRATQEQDCLFSSLMIGMLTILFTTHLSLSYSIETTIFSTKKNEKYGAAYFAAAVLGAVLLFLQVVALVRLFFSSRILNENKILEVLFTPGILKMERRTKTAAERKVTLMVENALVHHNKDNANQSTSSHRNGLDVSRHYTALLSFQLQAEQTERIGGLWWGWKRVWNNSIFDEEGVWLHSSLIASTVTQFFVVVFLAVFWFVLITQAGFSASTNTPVDDDQFQWQDLFKTWE